MAAGDDKGQEEMVGVTRVLEYYGPKEWLDKVLQNSRVPLQGTLATPSGAYIKSGIVLWQPEAVTEDVSVAPKPVAFPRPGGKVQ